MESVGQPSPPGDGNLLGVPSFCCLDVDEDEGDVVVGIRPKSSPVPRRKSSVSDEDSDPEPPTSGSRRVSFADARGLSLVEVKEFGKWDGFPGCDPAEGEGSEEYHVVPSTFSLPLSAEEMLAKVLQHKLELEAVELLPGTTIIRGVIRVLNISFSKAVYVRTSLDRWATHFDLLAEYIPGSSDGVTDSFSFKLTLVPPFGGRGVRVDFCLRYETPAGTFWANNDNRNYVVFCQHRNRGTSREGVNKKSCLKTPSQNFSTAEDVSSKQESSQGNISTDKSKVGLEVDTMKHQKTSEPETSDQQQQKLQVENKENVGRRRRRKAARMAEVREYFAQRDGGQTGTDEGETPAEMKNTAPEGVPGGGHGEAGPTSEVETPRREPERGESGEQTQDMAVRAADESAENVREFDANVTTAAAASQISGFTFGMVVAPLYHQASGKLGGESQSKREDEGFGPPSEGRPTGGFVFAESGRKTNTVRCDETDSRDLNQIHPDDTLNNPPSGEEETSDQSFVNASPRPRPRLRRQDVSSGADSLNPQITGDSCHVTFDLLSQTTDKSTTSRPPEQTLSQTGSNEDEDRPRGETRVEPPHFTDGQTDQRGCVEANDDHDHGETASALKTRTSSKEAADGLNQTDDPATKRNEAQGTDVVKTDVSSETRRETSNICEGSEETMKGEDAPEKMDRREAAASDEGLFPAGVDEVKNWEMMVEEEEQEGKIVNLSGNDTEDVEDMIAAEVKEKVDHAVELGDEEWTVETESEETDAPEDTGVEKPEEPEGPEGPEEAGLCEEKQRVSPEGTSVGLERQNRTKVKDEDEEEIIDADSCISVEDRTEEEGDAGRSQAEGGSSGSERIVGNQDGLQSSQDNRTKVDNENPAVEGDVPGHDSTSAESDSDSDEVELYMHCLRAAGAPPHPQNDKVKESTFPVSKRPSVSRSRPPPSPMPSISESLDEDQNLSVPQETHEDPRTAAVATPSVSGGQDDFSQNVSWWKNSFSCSNITKTFLYATLLAVFLVVAYHFDFLACFGLYVASVVWLCCQGDRQPMKNNNNNKAAADK